MLAEAVWSQKFAMSFDETTENPTGLPDTSAVSRHLLRTEQTQLALLMAAEKIFARDGFEAARIEEIAAEAGRTRGAFYANFENKADVFLALRNRMIRRRARALKDRITHLLPGETRTDAVLGYLMEQFSTPQEMLLQIEFKLFALRHPARLTELAKLHLDTLTQANRDELSELFPEGDHESVEVRRVSMAIEALMEGFSLNILFSPGLLTREYLNEMLPPFAARILSGKL